LWSSGSQQKRSADPQRRSSNPDQGAQQNSARPTPHLGAVVQALLLLQEPMMAQVGRFRESRPDALASFKLSSWPVYGPLVVPRSCSGSLKYGLVNFPNIFPITR